MVRFLKVDLINIMSNCMFVIKSADYFSIFEIGIFSDSLFTNIKSNANFIFHEKKNRNYDQ